MTITNIIVLGNDDQPIGVIQTLSITEKVSIEKPASVNCKLEISRMRLSSDKLHEIFQDGKFHVMAQKYPVHIVVMEDNIETIQANNTWLSGITTAYTTDKWIIAEGVEAECESITGTRTYKSSSD